jgi:hypothetical protein
VVSAVDWTAGNILRPDAEFYTRTFLHPDLSAPGHFCYPDLKTLDFLREMCTILPLW